MNDLLLPFRDDFYPDQIDRSIKTQEPDEPVSSWRLRFAVPPKDLKPFGVFEEFDPQLVEYRPVCKGDHEGYTVSRDANYLGSNTTADTDAEALAKLQTQHEEHKKAAIFALRELHEVRKADLAAC